MVPAPGLTLIGLVESVPQLSQQSLPEECTVLIGQAWSKSRGQPHASQVAPEWSKVSQKPVRNFYQKEATRQA